ncbi:hypothetical protein [Okeania sp. SIO1I7]|uniref:hypothetical protein n=1 Tax=Okeania sp. SIO1I7 TaxID=2607772 RepID=UPI0013FAC3DF|nr:hypothetical protein [Okeania sp. SIO1I7]NET29720.1 gas vesicle protein [Okeania sp. SIO1I7]
MHRSAKRGKIPQKISSMPRQRSEATTYLTVYKNVVEKERLQKELQNLERRCNQIKERLAVLDEQTNKELKSQSQQPIKSNKTSMNKLTSKKLEKSQTRTQEPPKSKFKTITLGY